MSARTTTVEQKRLDTDLWIILAVTFAVLAVYLASQSSINALIRNTQTPLLPRTLLAAVFQFGLAGLGISAVMVLRKESFSSFGLKAKDAWQSILLCAACFIPYILFAVLTGSAKSYLPFQQVWMTREALASSFPVNVLAMLIITAAWGFFEGFNYVVISQKINQRYPSSNRWINWGAIACGVMCLLIHGIIGVDLAGVIEMVTVFLIIYGMLVAKDFTGNAWGCVFIFVLLWNAF